MAGPKVSFIRRFHCNHNLLTLDSVCLADQALAQKQQTSSGASGFLDSHKLILAFDDYCYQKSPTMP